MSKSEYKIGMVVRHKLSQEWGLGEIEKVNENIITINFDKVGKKDFDSTIAPLKIIQSKKTKVQNSGNGDNKLTIKDKVNYFANPKKIYSLADLEESPPPSRPGIYGWYFDKSPPHVRNNGCTPIKTGWWPFRRKWWLLYIGQADKLKDRIMKYHIGGGHYAEGTMSSFRLSLGCLLSNEYSLRLFYPPESFGKKEKKLNKWLEKHARIAWIETEYIDAKVNLVHLMLYSFLQAFRKV